jgi:hypothetical protein
MARSSKQGFSAQIKDSYSGTEKMKAPPLYLVPDNKPGEPATTVFP